MEFCKESGSVSLVDMLLTIGVLAQYFPRQCQEVLAGTDPAVPSAKNALDLPFLFFEGETMSPISALKTSGMTRYEQPISRGIAIPPGVAVPVADGGHQSADTIF